MSGEWGTERVALRKADELGKVAVDLRLGVRAERLDLVERHVHLSDGESVAYDGLVIATGSEVRRLPGQPDMAGLFTLRTLDDCLALRSAVTDGTPRVVVIGAGFIGSEVAATARGLGCEVTIVEVLPVPLARALGEEMGAALAELHRDHGVQLRLGVGVEAFEGAGRVERLRLTDGTELDADVVVVGVGVAPATGWLADSGLELRDGVVCDATLAAGPPGVYAAGDVCRWPNELFGEEMRVEHWTNAAEQGALAARNLLVDRDRGPCHLRTPRCRSSGATSTAPASSSSGRAGAERRGPGGAAAPSRSAASSLSTGEPVASAASLGLSRPRLVMRLPARCWPPRATWDDALAHAAATR